MSSPASPASGQETTDDAVLYHEQLLPSVLTWLIAPAFGLAVWFMLSAIDNLLGLGLAAVITAGVSILLWRTSPQVRVTTAGGRRWLHAGPARIAEDYLGRAEVLDGEAMRQAMGPQLHTTAYVCHRPWVRTGIRVPVTDDADPAPYWLIATRHPQRLIAALDQGAAQEHGG